VFHTELCYRSHEVDRRRNTEEAADNKEVEKLLKGELQKKKISCRVDRLK